MTNASPTIHQPLTTGMRSMLYIASFFVLLAGISLFILGEHTDVYFAWTIKSPLTAAFLGGGYWATCALEYLAAREGLWVRARSTVPAVIIFTGLTLIVTLLHLDKFHFGAAAPITRIGTWAWLFIYTTVPIILLVLLIQQLRIKGIDPERTHPLPAWMKQMETFNGIAMLLFGTALLISPTQTASFWPWALTALTGRAMGAWWFGLGILALHNVYENDITRTRAVRACAILFGIFQFIAIARYPEEINWGQLPIWMYLIFLIEYLLIGIQGLRGLQKVSVASN